MEGNREIGVVINGRIRTCYLCFAYTLFSTVSFVCLDSEEQEREPNA